MAATSVVLVWCVAVGVLLPSSAAATSQERAKACPDPDDILPCICAVNGDGKLEMDCSEAQDENELAQVFQANFPDTEVYQLTIQHDPTDLSDRLVSIGADTFGDVSFERVIISGSQLEAVDAYALASSYHTLQHLNLSANRLNGYPFAATPRYQALRHLYLDDNYLTELFQVTSTSLQVLSVSGNFLTELQDSVFAQSPALRELYLADTGLAGLQPGLFSSLGSLHTLHLQGNTLATLPMSSITLPSHTLTSLTLDSNLMGNIEHDSIIGLSPNATLRMRKNEIEELNEEAWLHVFTQLTGPHGRLDLADNPLTCGCDLAWIMLDPEDRYRLHISDSTTCGDGGPILIYLDKAVFEQFC